MSKKSTLPQARRHIWVYEEDWAFMRENFGEAVGTSRALREMIHNNVKALRARIAERQDQGVRALRAQAEEAGE